MHRWEGRAVLDVGPAFQHWALAEGLHDEPGGGASPGEEGAAGAFLLPRGGDQYLLEAGIPSGAQAVPVRVRPPAGARVVEVRGDDGSVVRLGPPFVGRVEPRPGRRRVELWLPGGDAPLASADYLVIGATP
jgi:hypothetical protein